MCKSRLVMHHSYCFGILKSMQLFKNNRFYILLAALGFSVISYVWVIYTVVTPSVQTIRLEEIFGFTALILFYISLLIGPVGYRLKQFPWTKQLFHARRAIGVSTFYFALLHTCITFFGQLGGIAGIAFLDIRYLVALGIGLGALCILFLLAITSFDAVIKKMGFVNWKMLHRCIYFAGILLLVHILLLGSQYIILSGFVSQLTFFALAILLYFEAPRIDAWLQKKFHFLPTIGIGTTIIIIFLFLIYVTLVSPLFPLSSQGVSFDIHAAHRQLAQQVAQNQVASTNSKALQIPGLQGDRTLRYTVSWNNPQNVLPGQNVDLSFRVYDAQNGEPVSYFKTPYAKVMHLVIVSGDLTYFAHIHPAQNGYDFTITTSFPSDGIYHLYLDFQPWNAIEQQVAFTLPVGNATKAKATQQPDTQMTKIFGNYEVTLDTHGPLSADDMTFGNQTISFTIQDAKTYQPITTLKPYLASFGHMVMIDASSYNYLHVHPYALVAPPPNANGGPTVDFLPIGVYGPIHPGIYRLFAQFNPDNNLFTADFTVRVGK